MTTTEGNVLIAEFMEVEKCDRCNPPCGGYKLGAGNYLLPEELNYDASWDELIPVIKKIKDYLNSLPRPSKNHCCRGDLLEVDIQCHLWNLDIEKTNAACVIFIQWYNTQTPTASAQ